ncbi:MAG: Na+:solute symporter [Spirochaetales bacterium]|nr:Na+:solute symporter [Leptospiraceae bacterium]MCP5483212.1 Na+:solute symporter [Spirochaetales bacterium]MCP5486716.1 Na+:solute symporter [Spirochaetales bacterium]
MELKTGDLIVIAMYFIVSLGLGLALSRRGGHSLKDYFLSGSSVPWWLVGTGMVATTFAADTPLSITNIVSERGIAGNWVWWSMAAGGMLTVFFFAPLWRRAGVLTDLELIELRYSGPIAEFLRSFKALYFGVFLNCIVMGWVNLALLSIVRTMFPQADAELAVTLCALVTLAYVAVSGLWGVMIADAFQFVTALVGCAVLAIFAARHPAVEAAGGLVGAQDPASLSFFPQLSSEGPFFESSMAAFLAYVLIQWWASWYPGAEPGGGGYIAQRIMSARDERHGILATLWFVVAHYCVRSWPWILAALATLILYPGLTGGAREASYVSLIADVLPSPLRGLLIAAFAGAYMSTISTHLNWGASYVINDFYKRRFVPNADEKHYIQVSRGVTVALMIISLPVSFYLLSSVKEAWEFLLDCTAGMGFVLILRWYWWRINAAAELASMVAPIFVVVAMRVVLPAIIVGFEPLPAPQSLFVVAPLSVLATLVVMYLTAPERNEVLQKFYERVRPRGPGWAHYGSGGSLGILFVGWVLGTALVYAGLFAPGYLLLGRFEDALPWLVLLVVAVLGLVVLFRRFIPGRDSRSSRAG